MKFATGNNNKLMEVRSILGNEIESISIDLLEIQDPNMENVVKHKALEAWNILGEEVMIEDTSLLIESMNDLPGPFIKWFLKALGNEGLVNATNMNNRRARAVTYVASFDGYKYNIGYGEILGTISIEPRGDKGFGWDPIFIPNGGESRTFAEMDIEEKNKYSMRKIALMDFAKR